MRIPLLSQEQRCLLSSFLPLCFLGLLSSVRGLSFLNDCQTFVHVVEVKKQGSLESSKALVGSNMVD